jgi:uncharacterized phage-associated protein
MRVVSRPTMTWMPSRRENRMVNVFDVAEYILAKQGEIPAVKLHKLLYYSQAWSLVWDERPLFTNRIEAWKNGPVVRDLYSWHRLEYSVAPGKFKGACTSEALSDPQTETIDVVLNFYGPRSTQWLSDLTHNEDPWRNARKGVADGDSSDAEITMASMMEYYGSLTAAPQ